MNKTQNDELDQLVSTVMELWRTISQCCANVGIKTDSATALQIHMLFHIKEKGPLTMGELADICHMSLSSATQIVERLTKAGFAERSADPHDRRRVCIQLTATGKAKLAEHKSQRHAKLKEIFSQVPEKDIKELIRIQTNLIKALDA